MEGKIIKLLKDLYFVSTPEGIIASKARGLFRERKISPLVGDMVRLRMAEDGSGYIEEVFPRKNQMIRPEVANIDLLINIHSIDDPKLNPYMLDKGLIMAEFYGIESIIIFSKSDLTSKQDFDFFKRIYEGAGYKVFKTSYHEDDDIDLIKAYIKDRTSAVSGPSGTGKSTFINRLNSNLNIQTSEVSKKTKRGRHTTRHIELMPIFENTFILDTPGFSTIGLEFIEDERQLDEYFPEIKALKQGCKFNNCMHINEPGCQVKKELNNKLSQTRYENYLLFIEEIKEKRKY